MVIFVFRCPSLQLPVDIAQPKVNIRLFLVLFNWGYPDINAMTRIVVDLLCCRIMYCFGIGCYTCHASFASLRHLYDVKVHQAIIKGYPTLCVRVHVDAIGSITA